MKRLQDKVQALLLGLILIFVVLTYFKKKDQSKPETTKVGKTHQEIVKQTKKRLNNQKIDKDSSRLTTDISQNEVFISEDKNEEPEKKNRFPYTPQLNRQVTNGFFQEAYVKFRLPNNFAFKKFNNDDDIEGMIGKDRFSENHFGVLAKEGKFNLNQAVDYLNKNQKKMEILGDSYLKIDSLRQEEARKGSGLNNIQYAQIGKEGSKKIYVALAQREDGLGTYLFMLNADDKFLNSDEEYLDRLYDSIQASR